LQAAYQRRSVGIVEKPTAEAFAHRAATAGTRLAWPLALQRTQGPAMTQNDVTSDSQPGGSPMLDVAIVGAGLCGLALAHSLQARRIDWMLFEARDRLGGRVLTRTGAQGQPLDLGPSWYWPATQPSITRLVDDLCLAWIEQADDGRALWLDDPNAPPRVLGVDAAGRPAEGAQPRPGGLHGGARRLAGGMSGLIEALAERLPGPRLLTDRALHALQDAGDHVVLQLRRPGDTGALHRVQARRVVLALPPRLAEARVDFQPALPGSLCDALQATPTWMATAAKSAVACARPFWRDAGRTGNACVTHPQAVLAEVFDASPAGGSAGALGGFMALGVAAREGIRPRSLDLLVESQLGMLFGPAPAELELRLQDWASEAWTCSPLDRAEDAAGRGHTGGSDPRLRQPHWGGRLLFGGSETAERSGGYLEGALNAAARLRRQLAEEVPNRASVGFVGLPPAHAPVPSTPSD
jgi:monoamine oxidase